MSQSHYDTQNKDKRSSVIVLDQMLIRPGHRGFARAIDTLDELEPSVRAAFQQNLIAGEHILKIIFAPSQRKIIGSQKGFWGWISALFQWETTPNWVILMTQKRLLLETIRKPGEPPQITATPVEKILSLQLGSILLTSWFEWTWNQAGSPASDKIYFNTVGRDLFKELARDLRCARIEKHRMQPKPGGRNLEILENLPYKFKNLIPLHLLLPDESIRAMIYRPSIWEKKPGFFLKHIAAKLVLILTNYHLLIAEEELTYSEDNYGLIATFCPLRGVRQASVEKGPEVLRLKISLSCDTVTQELDIPFPVNLEEALKKMAREIPFAQ